jgi:hypothetical protein
VALIPARRAIWRMSPEEDSLPMGEPWVLAQPDSLARSLQNEVFRKVALKLHQQQF